MPEFEHCSLLTVKPVPVSQAQAEAGPYGKFRYEALALKYCLVIFHDSTQRHTNPPQHAERLEYYDRVH